MCCNKEFTLIASITLVAIAPELEIFWITATRSPYDNEKKKRSAKRRKGRAVDGEAGFDGNLEELELLPMDDEANLQAIDIQNHEVRVGRIMIGSPTISS